MLGLVKNSSFSLLNGNVCLHIHYIVVELLSSKSVFTGSSIIMGDLAAPDARASQELKSQSHEWKCMFRYHQSQ